jgi:hypothetical protein
MSQAHLAVAAVLLLGLLAPFATATLALPDTVGPPGYFDGGDGGDALWLVTEGLPALLLPVVALALLLGSRVGPPRAALSARSLAAPLAARLRAPPLL